MARVPEHLVERLALGELDVARAAEVRAQLAGEPGGLERLEQLKTSDARILAAHPPALVAREVGRRLGRPARQPRRKWLLLAPALAAAGVALVVVNTQSDTERLKGPPAALHVFRQRAGTAEPLRPGADARAGDLIQLSIFAPGAYAAVVSFDGGGGVTRHFPDGAQAARLGPGELPLPRSFELDAAPRFERFVLVTSARPFAVAQVAEAARAAAASGSDQLPLPSDLRQSSFLLRKVSP